MFCTGRKNSMFRYMTVKYGFCKPQNHHLALFHLRQKTWNWGGKLQMSRCVDLSCVLSVLPTFCFLLFRNNRVILQRKPLQPPKSPIRGVFWDLLPRRKHSSATHGRKVAEKFWPAWCFAEILWNFVCLLFTSVIWFLLVLFHVFAGPRLSKKHVAINFERRKSSVFPPEKFFLQKRSGIV